MYSICMLLDVVNHEWSDDAKDSKEIFRRLRFSLPWAVADLFASTSSFENSRVERDLTLTREY